MSDVVIQPMPQPALPKPSNWEAFKNKAGNAAEAGKRFFNALYRGASALLSKIYDFIIEKVIPKIKEAGRFVAAHFKKAFDYVSTHREKVLLVAAGAVVGILITCVISALGWGRSGQSTTQPQSTPTPSN